MSKSFEVVTQEIYSIDEVYAILDEILAQDEINGNEIHYIVLNCFKDRDMILNTTLNKKDFEMKINENIYI
jgi:hypothetical protein